MISTGSREGQTQLIRVGNNVEVYQWNMATKNWDKVGDMVADADGASKSDKVRGLEEFVIDSISLLKIVRCQNQINLCFSFSPSDLPYAYAVYMSTAQVVYEGKEYDYVFTVELDGQPSKKLPYNVADDPWMVAHKWLEQHELSPLFLGTLDSLSHGIYLNVLSC